MVVVRRSYLIGSLERRGSLTAPIAPEKKVKGDQKKGRPSLEGKKLTAEGFESMQERGEEGEMGRILAVGPSTTPRKKRRNPTTSEEWVQAMTPTSPEKEREKYRGGIR